MTLDPAWTETALRITGGFETAGDPFAGVAGDFDRQGLSLGVLQWNIGQGTLQPLVRNVGASTIFTHMPGHGGEFWAAVTAPVPKALEIVRDWQENGALRPDVKAELTAFAGAPEMRREQIAAAAHIAEISYRDAEQWVRQRGTNDPGKKEFFWFFDLHTQNGGLKGLSLADVRGFIAQSISAADAVCDWLSARKNPQFGTRDCIRNAGLWRHGVAPADLDLLVLSYLRALKSSSISQGVVLNRKGTLATGRGWVNDSLFDLTRFD